MGVPENTGSSGPMRKRQRLSLKSTKKKTEANGDQKVIVEKKGREDDDQKAASSSGSWDSFATSSATSTTSSGSSVTQSSSVTGSDSTLTSSNTDTTTSSATDHRVPAVASLENLGNTCFMNSIMQVLRYTPGFLDNLGNIYQNIQMSEKIKKKMKPSEESKDSERELEDQKNCWNVAKSVYKVYRDQSLLEEKYEEIATDDGMSMAVKPIKVLQAVRTLNPMFEGFLQHDAQEFLRCFLAYMQDAEKEIKKFSLQMPKALPEKSVINPLMLRFLQSAKPKRDKLETASENVSVKVENPESCDETKGKDGTGTASMDKAKINLFSKLKCAGETHSTEEGPDTISEPQKPTSESPVKKMEKMLPRIGHTAEHAMGKEPDDVSGLQTASMLSVLVTDKCPVTLEVEEGSRTERMKNRKLMKGQSKKQKESSPRKNSQGEKRNSKLSTITVDETVRTNDENFGEVTKGKIHSSKKMTQPSITDMYSKTYSKNKRLGMSRSVTKQTSAEKLFDALQESEKPNEIKQESCISDLENGSVIRDISDETVDMSKLEPCSIGSDASNTSVYSHFLSAVNSGVDDGVDTLTESDEEETKLIMEKKRAKVLHQSPRRSPRKANSQMFIPSPAMINMSVFSKSESDIKSVRLNLDFDSVSTTDIQNQQNVSPLTNIANGKDKFSSVDNDVRSTPMDIDSSPGRIRVDCDISFRKQTVAQPVNSKKIALEPIIKLENCDYVFKNNETSVSASFATKCLSPSKRTPNKDCVSGNYLKQRNLLESMVSRNKDELEKALEAMFNSPAKSNSKTDFIEQLFQGSMMLRTRCLVCETSTERQEDFHDISVPVRLKRDDSDDEGETNKDSSMEENRCSLLDMIEASTEPEKLQNDNKYFCGECLGYKEAEHSIHYDVMPDILTLHLKRFSACSGNFGHISKINDAVDIPMTLPCLRYKCPQSCLRPDHRYKLYGIITHTGVTLSSGHYLAYVRARPQPDNPGYSNTAKDSNVNSQTVNNNPIVNTDIKCDKLPTTRGKSGIAPKLPSRFDRNVVSNTKVKAFANIAGKGKKLEMNDSLKTNRNFATQWFECDDECIRVFEESEFMDILSEEQGSLLGTPYLLFYHKSTIY